MMLLGTQRINAVGHLEIGGVDVTDLAQEYGTPLYVMDEQALRKNVRDYLAAFRLRYPRVDVSFASKAFLCTGICKIFEQEGAALDVASGGELFTALRAGFPPARISVHGNNKPPEELKMALAAQVSRIVIDNFNELDHLEKLVAERTVPQPVLMRVAPGIDPHTHRAISTGQVDTKFGFMIENGDAIAAVRRVSTIPGLRLKGLHCHVGSQLQDTECHEASVETMVLLLARVKAETGLELDELNIGGGLGIRYSSDDRPPFLDEFAEAVTGVLKRTLDRAGLRYPTLHLEPGRFLVGETGTTLYTVGSLKQIPNIRTFVTVDGGLSDNPRPAMYQARYEAIVGNKATQPHDRVYTVSGKHCETDTLFSDIRLAPVVPGDILVVQSTGAYNFSMASNYNRFRRPAVVLVNDGQVDVLVRRQTYEDLVAQDVVPERFK
jgi:diaminopimelate decarboxylase